VKRGNREFREPKRSILGALAWFCGVLAWAAAAAVGALMAVVFAATVVAVALIASVPLALSVAAMRARRSVRAAPEPDLLEARRVGGHSWVAYVGSARR
jgi:hypothetical protein